MPLTVAIIDTTRVIEIAQYVVEGARGLDEALDAIRAAKTCKTPSPVVRVKGYPMRVWLRGHYQQQHMRTAP